MYKPATIPEEAKKIAAKFFEHAQTVADTRNYDYAIELYLQGLNKNPEAVEHGHAALRDIALKRKGSGGKGPGLIETLKRSTTHKDPMTAMLNSSYLLAKDPLNPTYVEALAKSADRAELPETLHWILPLYLEATRQAKKVNINRLMNVRNFYEKMGDYYESDNKVDLAVECFQRALAALGLAMQEGSSKVDLTGEHRDLASKLTILKGKYEKGEGFRSSIQDAEAQEMIRDSRKAVKGEDLLKTMIEKAREELRNNPTVAGKVNKLVDVLLQRGTPQDEAEATEVLLKSHEQSGQYSFKMRVDDIKIRQARRQIRELRQQLEQNPADEKLKDRVVALRKELVAMEIDIFKQRTTQYPTDLHIKFDYAMRLFQGKQFDEAIPLFQDVRREPRYGVKARYYIGYCFLNKGWFDQAIDSLTEAIENYPVKGDDTYKEMYYVLAQAYEQAGQADQALQTYSEVIKLDYNYRDARKRLEALKKT